VSRESNISEEHIASIFRVEESVKRERAEASSKLSTCWVHCSTMKVEPICSLKYLSTSELLSITIEKTILFSGLITFTGLHHHAKLHVYVTKSICIKLI
jgi:hypothetical protein